MIKPKIRNMRSMLMGLVCWTFFFFSSRRRHTRFDCDWSSDVCSSDLFASQLGVRPVREASERGVNAAVERGMRETPDSEGWLILPADIPFLTNRDLSRRSEERRVGKECRSRWSPYH